MKLKSVLDDIAKNLELEINEKNLILRKSQNIVSLIEGELKSGRIEADVFIGGSFAKNTLVRGDFYDVDVFIRFDWRYGDISKILEKILKKAVKKKKMTLETLHGSRDYFRIIEKNIIFEIIPVVKIKKPREARNVTDLSYFHINYIRRKLKKRGLEKEVILAKQFCKAQKVYGAESYVSGFSGYALECLIVHYLSFEKMLRDLIKVKLGERLIIDIEKDYKRKRDILFDMNESKISSPVILIDPTWKERNALAALKWDTFKKFQEGAREFLKNPGREFFEIKKLDEGDLSDEAKRKNAEFLKVYLETKKQPGDIAGTKMKKFASYLERELGRYFFVIGKEFDYSGENNARAYLIVKSKKEITKTGPPSDFEKHARAFRKNNKDVFEKEGNLFAREKIKFSAKEFIKTFKKKYGLNIESMGISKFEIN